MRCILPILFTLGVSMAAFAQDQEPQEDTPETALEKELSVSISDIRPAPPGNGLRPVPLLDSDPLPPRTLEEALADPDTRVYALKPEGFDYEEVPGSKKTDDLTKDQIDNLRLLTNPVQRLDDLSAKDGVTSQLPPGPNLENPSTDKLPEPSPEVEKD